MVAAALQNLNIEVHSSCVFISFSTIVSAVMCAAWNLNVVHCLMKLDAKLRDRQRNKCANQYMHMLSKYDRYIATVRHNNWSKLLSFILIWSTHKKKCHLMLFDVVYTNWNENKYPHRHKCTAHTYRNMKMIFSDGFGYGCVSKPYNN